MRCRDWIPGGTSNRDGRCAMWMTFLMTLKEQSWKSTRSEGHTVTVLYCTVCLSRVSRLPTVFVEPGP